MRWAGAVPTLRAATSRTQLKDDPAANTWTTKAATYADNQVNNMACGVMKVAGTPYIYCVGGSAAIRPQLQPACSSTTLSPT